MAGRPWLANLDMYRKVPGDLMEGSQQGSAISWATILFILVLFLRETQIYLTPALVTDLSLDRSLVDKIRVNFDITLTNLKCQYATINAVSVLGSEQNVTKNIHRWAVDADLVRQNYVGALNHQEKQHEVALHDSSITESLESLHENGVDVVPLDPETFLYALEEHEFVFVDWYAGWCSHCKRFAPTWERFAEVMHDVEEMDPQTEDYSAEEYEQAKRLQFPVLIASVDCVAHHAFCGENRIMSYPTLTLYTNGNRYKGGVYRGDRTIVHMLQYLLLVESRVQSADDTAIKRHADIAVEKHLNMTQEHREWYEAMERTHHHHEISVAEDPDHEGCRLDGALFMNRVPGHFYIQAQSASHSLAPSMTNLSMVVHHLNFGDLDPPKLASDITTPKHYAHLLAPMNDQVYTTDYLHEAFHFHLKLVSTNSYFYQVLESHHLSMYQPDRVPEVKFVMDLSPIAVTYRLRRRPWYDYLTSLLAIVGGSFTVLGMVNSVYQVGSRKLATRKKYNYPRPPQRSAP